MLAPSVDTPSYVGHALDWKVEASSAARFVEAAADHADFVQLVGASLGGDLVPFVVQQLSDEIKARLQVVIVDAPAGADTLMALPSWSAGFMASSFGRLATPIGLIRIPPKEDEITVPSQVVQQRMSGEHFDDDVAWKRYIIERAKKELKGHSARLWRSQIAWMIRIVRDGSLAEACKSLEGLDVTYLVCTGKGNGVVRQPEALAWWGAHVDGLKVEEVNATHCGFLQNQPEFAEAFRKILER